MLFLLTGSIQSGKTRWLTRVIEQLAARGVTTYGVLAPGRWLEPDEDGKREKVGIDNVLLPGGARIDFATRRDLAEVGGQTAESDACRAAHLGWAIHEDAMEQVNRYFAELQNSFEHASVKTPALLVIDELGTLELTRGEGLVNAVEFAESFPSTAPKDSVHHGIIVVRPSLIDEANARFAPTWGEPLCIVPDDNAENAVLEAFDVQRGRS